MNTMEPNIPMPTRKSATMDGRGFSVSELKEEGQRQDGLLHAPLHEREERGRREREPEEPEDRARSPGVLRSSPDQAQEERDQGDGEEERARVVDRPSLPVRLDMRQQGPHRGERHDPDRDVDEEIPPPGRRVGEPSAERGPDDRGEPEHAAEKPLPSPALRGGIQVPHHGERVREDGARPQALDRSKEDELGHVPRNPREHRSHEEEDDRGEDEGLPAVEVGELPVDRHHDGGGEKIRRDYPAQVLETVKLLDDARERGRDDGLIERRQEERQHDAEHDEKLPGIRDVREHEEKRSTCDPRLASPAGVSLPSPFPRSRFGP